MRTDVAIVGGGIAGLTVAYRLAQRGVSFLLLEAQAQFGGVIRTEIAGGFVIDAGPDAILAQKPEGMALIREVGLSDRLLPTNQAKRAVFILHRGRLHSLPEGMILAVPTRIGPFLRSGLFSWPGKLRMGLDMVIPGRKDGGDESIASFLRRRFGEECVERLGEPLLAGIHAGDPERLSIQSTFPRFVDIERRSGSLVRGMLLHRPPKGGGAAAFYSLEGGLVELVDALVARIPANQALAGRRLAAISANHSGYRLTLADGDLVEARTVVMALPAPLAAPLLEPLAPAVAPLLAGIPFASTATVSLGYRREDVSDPLDGYGMVVPKTEGLRCSACSFLSTKFPGRAPAGHVLLRGFLGGVRDPQVLEQDDEALAALVRREMTPVLGLRGEPVLQRVCRWPSTTPQMEVGHAERITRLDAEIAKQPGLHLIGAGLRGTGIPDCVAEAQRLVETLYPAAGARISSA